MGLFSFVESNKNFLTLLCIITNAQKYCTKMDLIRKICTKIIDFLPVFIVKWYRN